MENEVGLRDLAKLIVPDVEIATTSNPEPVLRAYNVISVYDEQDDTRNAVLALESIEVDDAAIGLVTFGSDKPGTGMQPVDHKITGETMGRAARGAAIGAAISAAVVGLGSLLLSSSASGAIAGAVGGALFGAIVGGLWGAFVRFGGSDAYRQSFSGDQNAATLVALHTDSADHAQEAKGLMGLIGRMTPVIVRREDERLWTEP